MAKDRKEYFKAYNARKDVKEKNKLRMREEYDVKYEHSHSRYPRSRYVHARNMAKRRKMEFDLTFEQYCGVIKNNCYYCNGDVSKSSGSSLDRVDNDKGYLFTNVVCSCGDCNRRRSRSMSSEEFKRQSKLNGRWREDK